MIARMKPRYYRPKGDRKVGSADSARITGRACQLGDNLVGGLAQS